MGIIHSRAGKKRARAEAKLAKEQAKLAREQAKLAREQRRQDREQDRQDREGDAVAAAEGLPWYRQPTLGSMITAWQGRGDSS